MDPVFFDFKNDRANQKAKYKGEFFPSIATADPGAGLIFEEFFQVEKFTGGKKGIIKIDLQSESFDSITEVHK